MNSIPKNEILEYNSDTFTYLRKYYNYDHPGKMDEAIDLLDEWVKKQPHIINKEYPREVLERTIILLKGSVERAKNQIEKLCTMKTLLPHAFDRYDAKNHFNDSKGFIAQGLLPKLTEDHYRVFVFRFLSNIVTSKILTDSYKNGVLVCEYIKAHDYCNGFIGILDFRNVSLKELIPAINMFEITEMCTILTLGYSTRIKGIHIITSNSKLIGVIIGMFKPVFGAKISNRIFVHNDLESLHKHVLRDILPVELGGSERSIVTLHDQWTEVFTSKENLEYFKKVYKNGTIEKLRPQGQFNEMYMGMTGSFRNIHVD